MPARARLCPRSKVLLHTRLAGKYPCRSTLDRTKLQNIPDRPDHQLDPVSLQSKRARSLDYSTTSISFPLINNPPNPPTRLRYVARAAKLPRAAGHAHRRAPHARVGSSISDRSRDIHPRREWSGGFHDWLATRGRPPPVDLTTT